MPGPTLSQLDDPNYKPEPAKQDTPPPPPPPPTLVEGDGTKRPADLELERQKQVKEAEELERQKQAQQQQQNDNPPELTAEQQANVDKGLNPDGTTPTAEQLAAAKKAKEDADAEQADETAIWAEVDKIWGRDLKVDYKGADGAEVHPNSPEGMFIREQAIADRAVEDFEDYLMKTDPRAYEYILHRRAGGTDEDFYAKKTVTLPVYEEFQNSVDLKTKVVSESLRLKGVPENVIKLTIDDAIKNKTLDAMADTSYKETQRQQQAEIDRLNQANAQAQATYDRSVKALEKALTEEMSTGMKIIVPEAKKTDFNKYVRERIQDNDGQFFFVNPIDAKSLPQLLDAMYFQFSRGDLGQLVQRQAQTQNTVRFRKHVQASQQKPSGTEMATSNKKTLGEL